MKLILAILTVVFLGGCGFSEGFQDGVKEAQREEIVIDETIHFLNSSIIVNKADINSDGTGTIEFDWVNDSVAEEASFNESGLIVKVHQNGEEIGSTNNQGNAESKKIPQQSQIMIPVDFETIDDSQLEFYVRSVEDDEEKIINF